MATLGQSVQAHFATQAKGHAYRVGRSANDTGVVIRVDHGLHRQTQSYWPNDEAMRFLSYRPGQTDILFYETRTGLLHIRAPLAKDRDTYLHLFARDVGGDEDLVHVAGQQPVYTLTPLSIGSFSFAGDGAQVLLVQLRSVKIKLTGSATTTITLTADDVNQSLQTDLPYLSLAAGEILEARLRFHIWPTGGKATWVMATVKPPAHWIPPHARFTEIIEHYLEQQGVRVP